MDQGTAHPTAVCSFEDVNVVFLLYNCTNILQPLDWE
jgi:hypothetical protein